MIKKVLVIAGPTAVGKTATSIEIAKRINGEIVSADSMQVYKSLDIGTAKPDAEERRLVKHHMMDVCLPQKRYSVAEYVTEASLSIEDIFSRNKTPIIVGGTGLYIDNLIYNNDFGDFDIDESVRQDLIARADYEGGALLLEELSKVDPLSAQKLHKNDTRRIIRALEVFYSTGNPLSYYVEKSRDNNKKYEFLYTVLNMSSRELLYDRINLRVDLMMKQGLLEEAKWVIESPWYLTATASQAIGYKEFEPFFCGIKSLEECVDTLKQHSRNYAKRQLTWFRHNKDAVFYNVDEENDIAGEIINRFYS